MSTSALPNYYPLAWTLINILLLLVPVVIVGIIIWYVKQKQVYQEKMLAKMDQLVALMEDKANQ